MRAASRRLIGRYAYRGTLLPRMLHATASLQKEKIEKSLILSAI